MCTRIDEAPNCLFGLFIDSSLPPDAEFREPRVIELWEAAKRANLSQDELDSLKVTLTIFIPICVIVILIILHIH